MAIVVGLMVGVSPFTPRGIVASLLSGGLVGTAVFGFRLARANGSAVEDVEDTDIVVLPPLVFWAVLLALLTAFSPNLLWLYRQWTSSIWSNGHGLFTPFVMLYLGYMALRRDRITAPESSAWGFAFLVPGLALLVYDTAIHTEYLSTIGLVACLPGLCLLTLGARRTRMLALPLVVGLFMIPIPENTAIHVTLRQLTSVGVVPVLDLFGIGYVRDATSFLMPGVIFNITDACSGFSTLYAALGISLILSVHTRPAWRRVLLLVAAFPLALAANIGRIFVLMILCQEVGPHIMDMQIHPMSGVAVFILIGAVLMAVAGRRSVRAALA